MFARVKNSQIIEYPLTEWDIRKRINFFGSAPNFDVLLPADYIRVHTGSQPSVGNDEKIIEVHPIFQNNIWVQKWSVLPKTEQEIASMPICSVEQEMINAPKPQVPDIYSLFWDEEAKEWYPVLNQGAV